MLFYDLITNNLKHISLQTELLEACDWDEDELNEKLQFIQSFLRDYKPPTRSNGWDSIKKDLYIGLCETNNKNFIDIIIRVIEHHRHEFLQQLNLGDN